MLCKFIRGPIAFAAVAFTGQITSAATPTIYPLGIANGSVHSRGYSINDAGEVAVSSIQGFGQGTAGRYDGTAPGGTLRTLVPFAGYQTAFARAINARGQVAGYAQGATVFTPGRAYRYDGTTGAGGVMRNLGTLGGASSAAFGINDLGQVTGSAQADPNGPTPGTYAFVYTGTPGAGGVMKSLGALGAMGSEGIAINNTDQVAGTSQLQADGKNHAFRYDGPAGTGVMRDLGFLPDFSSSYAVAMNSSGQVVGDMDSADRSITHAFRYTGTPGVDGVMTDLGTPLGGTLSFATGINDAGYVLGATTDAAELNFYPVLWRPDGSFVDLQVWLNTENPTQGQYWDLRDSYITGISNTGLITGDGIYSGPGPENGHSVAFVLDASSLVPEPASLGLLGLAIITLPRRSTRRLLIK